MSWLAALASWMDGALHRSLPVLVGAAVFALCAVALGLPTGVTRAALFPSSFSVPTIRPPTGVSSASFASLPDDEAQARRVARDSRRRAPLSLERRQQLRAAFDAAKADEDVRLLRGLRAVAPFFSQVSAANATTMTNVAERLAPHEGRSVVLDVKGSRVYVPSDSALAQELGLFQVTYDLTELVKTLHEAGIYVIGRFIVVKDPGLAEADASTHIRHPRSNVSVGSVWVDPGLERVRTYNLEVLEDVLTSGIDEVNFDYIRYPTEYGLDAVGLSGAEKAERVEGFLREAKALRDRVAPKALLGISTYAILGWEYRVNLEYLGQDVVRFEPLVDVISPMAYPASFSEEGSYYPAGMKHSRMYWLVYRTMTGYRDLLGDQAWKLRPWIQGYSVSSQNLRDQIAATFDAGACGFSVWNARNDYTPLWPVLSDWRAPAECVPQGYLRPASSLEVDSGVPSPA